MSEAPREAKAYQSPHLWAACTAAVITELSLDHPILVGWSYGGFIISDHIRAYGQDHLSGIMFVGALTTSDRSRFIGPGLLNVVADATAEDFPTNIRGMRQFLRCCTAKPLPPDDFEIALCWNIIVRPDVRRALGRRIIDSDDVLSTLRVPLLIAHGRQDIVVKPSIAEHILEICPTATASWYDDVGHAPFLEDPARFNRELADLVHRVRP